MSWRRLSSCRCMLVIPGGEAAVGGFAAGKPRHREGCGRGGGSPVRLTGRLSSCASLVKLTGLTQKRFRFGIESARSLARGSQPDRRLLLSLLFPAPLQIADGPPKERRTVSARFEILKLGVDPFGA